MVNNSSEGNAATSDDLEGTDYGNAVLDSPCLDPSENKGFAFPGHCFC